jgi:XRE family aerobic/anaerobic benzoate catabolism transcriptional regulator
MANIIDALTARQRLYTLAHADIDTTDRQIDALVEQAVALADENAQTAFLPANAA